MTRMLRAAGRVRLAEWIVLAGLVVMALLFCWNVLTFAQMPATQDGINGYLYRAQMDLSARLDHIESMEQGIIIGVFLNLLAFGATLLKDRKR